MHSLYAGMYNETEKIFIKKKTIFFLVFSALISIGTATLIAIFQSKTGIFAFTLSGFPVLLLGLFTNFLLPLFIFSLAADIFAGEIGDNTMKLALTKPISRFKVFLAKNITLIIFIVVNLALVLVVSLLSGLFVNYNSEQPANILWTFVAYLTAIVPMIAISIFAAFIAQFFKNGSSALTATIFIYLGAKALPFIPFFTAKISRAILFSYTDWHTLWLGNSMGAAKLINIFLLLVAYSLVFFAAGYYLFDRKDH